MEKNNEDRTSKSIQVTRPLFVIIFWQSIPNSTNGKSLPYWKHYKTFAQMLILGNGTFDFSLLFGKSKLFQKHVCLHP